MMAQLEVRFIQGVIRKTLVLGLVGALAAGFWLGGPMALSVVIGTAIAALNLRFVAWFSRKMVDRAREGASNASGWGLLLLVKMFVLFGLIFVLIALLDVNAVGLVAGFSFFLPAIAWQAAVGGSEATQPEAGDPDDGAQGSDPDPHS